MDAVLIRANAFLFPALDYLRPQQDNDNIHWVKNEVMFKWAFSLKRKAFHYQYFEQWRWSGTQCLT